ncbi:beta-defensin 128 [Choloepus didactylus]|uniref:beta-defensin 128 n=1 Tax=Choloepus didactylus TaxID=27675 RepID=UPI00189DE57B|nr:beta-defensin 128 [Choloepus didactylus]
MKLILVLIVLLFEVPTEGARPKKCFNNIAGYCKKKCEMGEIYEVSCLNGKLCCVNEELNRRYLEAHKQPQPTKQSEKFTDYLVLPTVTLVTVQP